jgi:hypothetical protein
VGWVNGKLGDTGKTVTVEPQLIMDAARITVCDSTHDLAVDFCDQTHAVTDPPAGDLGFLMTGQED